MTIAGSDVFYRAFSNTSVNHFPHCYFAAFLLYYGGMESGFFDLSGKTSLVMGGSEQVAEVCDADFTRNLLLSVNRWATINVHRSRWSRLHQWTTLTEA
jgi:hypothetical protein